jgi:hypothetical protein
MNHRYIKPCKESQQFLLNSEIFSLACQIKGFAAVNDAIDPRILYAWAYCWGL